MSGDDLQDLMVALRRELHREPEVGLHLPRTQERVLAALRELPLEVRVGSGCSSVTAVVRGARPGPSVLIRADMDALPLQEKTGLDFAAPNGAMHACGHDLHTAMLVGAAHLLSAARPRLAGDVVLAFQPGEEGYDGAGRMLDEGLLDVSGSRPVAAFALHVTSCMFASGLAASRPGPILAAIDTLRVRVLGTGGHGAAPHRAKDPVQAAAAMVTALQTAVTREFDVFDPVVVTVGHLAAGTVPNVIPDEAAFEATVRSFSDTAGERLAEVLPRVCKGIALAHGVDVQVELEPLYPATTNDVAETSWALDLARSIVGDERVVELPHPLSGSEDFSRILNQVPGAMLFLGATPPGLDPADAPYNHAPEADFDEAVMSTGAHLLSELAERRLGRPDT